MISLPEWHNDPRIKWSTGAETHNIFFRQAPHLPCMDGSVGQIFSFEEISVLDREPSAPSTS
jgi:hypothetical protein